MAVGRQGFGLAVRTRILRLMGSESRSRGRPQEVRAKTIEPGITG